MSDEKDIAEAGVEALLAQVEHDGIATLSVSDGRFFAFTAKMLEHLLTVSKANPRQTAIVFVKNPTSSDVN